MTNEVKRDHFFLIISVKVITDAQEHINIYRIKGYFIEIFNSERKTACFNPLPDDKILDQSKLKQIADNI